VHVCVCDLASCFTGYSYGLVGKNGVGKSILLRRIEQRKIKGFPSYLSVVHVQQEQATAAEAKTPCQIVVDSDRERSSLLAEEAHVLKVLEGKQNWSM